MSVLGELVILFKKKRDLDREKKEGRNNSPMISQTSCLIYCRMWSLSVLSIMQSNTNSYDELHFVADCRKRRLSLF